MDFRRFDAIVHALSVALPRRGAIAAIAAVLATSNGAGAARKRQKPDLNAFGCVDVGGLCFGKDGLCCSGRCQGKKPKQGKKDKRRCAAHDAGTCQAGDDACIDLFAPCVTSNGNPGSCFTTTGNASFCTNQDLDACLPCTRDVDCVAKCGDDAACILCDDFPCFAQTGRYCVGLDRDCDPL